MKYIETYYELRSLFHSDRADKHIGGVDVEESGFLSRSAHLLPGNETHRCDLHGKEIRSDYKYFNDVGTLEHDVHIRDNSVEENRRFRYQILFPRGEVRSRKLVFLFHGFNEKDWSKYLPWARAICENTGRAVVLFPIAFHMQRAPRHWSDPRDMFPLSEERKRRFPNIVHSTLSNVAISMRLQTMPQRFVWSGLQTYDDILQLLEEFRSGHHPRIHPDFTFHIFAYSIGGFLAQILKLTNPDGRFDETRVLLFCAGATFNRFAPVSKFILDSEANVALYSFLVEHFDRILEKDSLLRHYIREDHPEGRVFQAMLDYQKMREFRENLLRRSEGQFYAITLRQDRVIPSFEVMNTLQGAYRDIRIRVDEMDFARPCIHENPFPAKGVDSHRVDEDFERVFGRVCAFLD
ncbi:MAG: DUF6051 family protein [Bacteroidales bacterium]